MAEKKISELDVASALQDTDLFEISQDDGGGGYISKSLAGSASPWLKTDASNDPITGDLEVSKADPEMRLTDTGNSEYTRLTLSDTLNTATRHNRVLVPGSAGSALQLDGSTDYMESGDIDSNVSTASSMVCWFKLDSLALGRIFNSGGGDNYGFTTFWNANQLTWRMGTGATFTSHSQSFTDTTSWHLIGITWDGSNVRYYLDGSEVGTPDASVTYGNGTSMALGARSGGTQLLTGRIDETAFWNEALSGNDMSDLWAGGSGLYIDPSSNWPTDGGTMGTNLEALWHIDEGTGTVSTADSSGNGNTMTFYSIEEGDWTTGHLTVPGSDAEVTVWSAADGASAGAEGSLTFGNSTADTVIDGGEIVLNNNTYIRSDTNKMFFGAGDDGSIGHDGTNIVIDPQEVGSGGLVISNMKSGATQVAAGAAADELWKTASHATLPDNVVMIGV